MNIYVSDWHNNFFEDVYTFVKEREGVSLENSIIVLSTSRAKQVAKNYFKENERNTLLPEIITVPEFLLYCYEGYFNIQQACTREVDSLESITILYEIVQNLAAKEEKNFYSSMLEFEHEETTIKRKELESFQHFYSYGQYLDAIIQECFEEDSLALSLKNVGDEVDGFAAYLLKNLRDIINAYKAWLDKNFLHTKSYRKYILAQILKQAPESIFKGKNIYFCGLDRITGTEEICFKFFSQYGSSFLISTDPLLVTNLSGAHWSTTFYQEWAKAWQADFVSIAQRKEKQIQQEFYFHQAFDMHSQFQDFAITDASVSTACILNNPLSIMPLLHSLNPFFDDESLNFTMGYPLSESKVFQLFNILTSFKDNARMYVNSDKKENIFIAYTDFIDFISFPLFEIPLDAVKNSFKSDEFAFINLSDFNSVFKKTNQIEQILQKYLALLIDWYAIQSIENLVNFIMKLDKVLKDKVHNKALERLALRRLQEITFTWRQRSNVLVLKIGYELCVKILFEKIKDESLAFEHHSDDSIQVLGLRETRLLSFDTVHIFDSNDEFLPPRYEENPLLPDNLRYHLGLKSLKLYELYTAHNWHRLLASANNVHLYWHESTAKGLFDTKKTRSPYVEEAMWAIEQKKGRILQAKDKEFTQAKCIIELPQRELSIPINDNIRQELLEFCKHSMSATKLDTFLSCPLKFFYQYITGLRGVSVPKEEDNPRLVGNLVHKFMEALYPNNAEIVDKSTLMGRYNNEIKLLDNYLEKENMYEALPAESVLMLKNSFPYKMKRFIAAQPESTKVLAKEKEFTHILSLKEKNIHSFVDMQFKGTIDRIDERVENNEERKHILLDYKTGSITRKMPNKTFWTNEELFQNLEQNVYNFTEEMAQALHVSVLSGLKSIQLPFYIFLTSKNNYSILDAAYVDFYESCAEKSILTKDNDIDKIINTQIPLLLEFLMQYMQSISSFSRVKNAPCAYCEYKKYCD